MEEEPLFPSSQKGSGVMLPVSCFCWVTRGSSLWRSGIFSAFCLAYLSSWGGVDPAPVHLYSLVTRQASGFVYEFSKVHVELVHQVHRGKQTLSLHHQQCLVWAPSPTAWQRRGGGTTHQWPRQSGINSGQRRLNLGTRILIPQPRLSVSADSFYCCGDEQELFITSTFL